jgi:ATP/maltotriose-dependent transcriptional regulator MalT
MNNRWESSIAEPLSERELEILHLLAQGLPNREIAQRLILSQETIKWYNKRAYGKLGVGSRSQAVARASELGLLSDHPAKPAQGLAGSRHRLPAEVSTFIGRQREMAEIKQLLNAARLVTLTGPGGTGKTRLGLQVAESMAGFYANGVTFVS